MKILLRFLLLNFIKNMKIEILDTNHMILDQTDSSNKIQNNNAKIE